MDQNNTPAPSIPLWQTIVFTLLALVVFLFAQTSALQHYTDSQVANFPEMDRTALLKLMSSDATAVSIVSIVGGIVATAFLLLVIHLRGLPIKQYLSVQAFSKRDLINWQLVMIGFIALAGVDLSPLFEVVGVRLIVMIFGVAALFTLLLTRWFFAIGARGEIKRQQKTAARHMQ